MSICFATLTIFNKLLFLLTKERLLNFNDFLAPEN